jgi:hypothetical protein
MAEVAFIAHDRRETHLVAKLDDGYPHPQGGYGGWEDIARPGRQPATNFVGASEGRTLPIAIILGHWQAGWTQSIESNVRLLERLAEQPVNARRGTHPPLLTVRGPVRHGGHTWVVDDLQWSDDEGSTVVNPTGKLVRTRVVVVLRRYVEPDLVVVGGRDRRRADATRFYRVKRGEGGPHGFSRLVARKLGARGSREINAAKRKVLALSGLRDSNQVREGVLLVLPR